MPQLSLSLKGREIINSFTKKFEIECCQHDSKGDEASQRAGDLHVKLVIFSFTKKQGFFPLIVWINQNHVLDWGEFALSSEVKYIAFPVLSPLWCFCDNFVYFLQSCIFSNWIEIFQVNIFSLFGPFQLFVCIMIILDVDLYHSEFGRAASELWFIVYCRNQLRLVVSVLEEIETSPWKVTFQKSWVGITQFIVVLPFEGNIVMGVEVTPFFLGRKHKRIAFFRKGKLRIVEVIRAAFLSFKNISGFPSLGNFLEGYRGWMTHLFILKVFNLRVFIFSDTLFNRSPNFALKFIQTCNRALLL